ncbi:MAG: tetratricopeptide repeat protein [Gammaproteobacteria bacterium]|nr:tetratricopeptide repeat protein [Gammaproteobacteria bacterium]
MSATTALMIGVTLAGGLWPFASRPPEPDRQTIGSLKTKPLEVQTGLPPVDSTTLAMDEYRRFLALDTGPAGMRAEAMRRLADLNLDKATELESAAEIAGAGASHFNEAISLYEQLLEMRAAETALAGEERSAVVYQLARALEGAGRGDESLAMLDRLVAESPSGVHGDEAQFRRGETWSIRQNYAAAEQAYAAVLASGPASAFYEQSLYKYGWALFKQSRYEEALAAFARLVDRRFASSEGSTGEQIAAMSRPERELLDDTLRVVSISLSYLDGADSIPPVLAPWGEPDWTYLFYAALGDLYLDKERFQDAAESYAAFVDRDPVNVQAPNLLQAAIDAYVRGKFPDLVLEAKQEYVSTYGFDAPFWQGRAAADHPQLVAQLKQHLGDLAQHDHALAQRSKLQPDYERAAGWYRLSLAYFPDDPKSAERSFLLGELLFEAGHFDQARDAYLRAAYDYGQQEKSAEAGYAALLASAEHEKRLSGEAQAAWHEGHMEQALRFAADFPAHPQAGAVLTTVAEQLYASQQPERAAQVAGLVVTMQPPVTPELERVAWTVIGHAQFELAHYAEAESAYVRLRSLAVDPAAGREVEGRIAASIYRQAELAQSGGDVDAAVADFLRIDAAAPGAEIRPSALFDAATLLLTSERWNESVDLLQRFRREFPEHRFNRDVTAKLALALRQGGRSAEAAAEYERIADSADESAELQRSALWQAAELHAAAGQHAGEVRVYTALVTRFPVPAAEALEARLKLADLAAAEGDWPVRQRWLESIVKADADMGAGRSDRSRFLAASSAIELARPLRDAFNSVALTAPLDRSLKLKKKHMEQALQAYGRAADYGVAQVTTAATFETADLYYQLSRDLLASERPKDLAADESEQYDLLLEEQAFPFEEKAIDLYRVNAERVADGIYDEWVRASYARLAVMVPARWSRTERSEDVITTID